MIVLDASVAVKWFRDEPGSELAEALLVEHHHEIIVPDLFAIEVAAALVRNANVNKPLGAEMRAALARFTEMLDRGLFELVSLTPGQLATAAATALDLGHPLKDCLYLTLAMKLGCPLITADSRFIERAQGAYAEVLALGE